MKIEPKANCPLNSFNPCKELECAWFMKVSGKDPTSGKDVDEWGCAMSWIPLLVIESSLHQRHTGAAVESLRNEVVETNRQSRDLLLGAAQMMVNPALTLGK